MDFARKHARDRNARDRLTRDDVLRAIGLVRKCGVPVIGAQDFTVGGGSVAFEFLSALPKTASTEQAFVVEADTWWPPRPCYRSVWDVYGLRRRPRTSRSRRP